MGPPLPADVEFAGGERRRPFRGGVRAGLTIPAEQGLWCPGEHDPLRVSGIQSGVFSGAVGSTIGQQPFREGAVVREFQPAQWGWTPH